MHVFSDAAIDDFMRARGQNVTIAGAVVNLWAFVLQDGSWECSDDAALTGLPVQEARAPQDELLVHEHEVIEMPWGFQCERCRRWARSGPHWDRLMAEPCRPLLGNLQAAGRIHASHVLHSNSHGMVWCSVCCCYADRRVLRLKDKCMPYPSRFGLKAVERLEQDLHPITGAPLAIAPAPGGRCG